MEHACINKTRLFLHDLIDEDVNPNFLEWSTVNELINEVKNNLIELNNDDNRIIYLKTVFTSLKPIDSDGWEDWISEVEDHFNFNSYHIKSFEDMVILDFINKRNSIFLSISEHCAELYGNIDFEGIIKHVRIKTKSTFWISGSLIKTEESNQPKTNKSSQIEIKDKLSQFGFFELKKVKLCNDQNKLMQFISGDHLPKKDKLPYRVAMLSFLGLYDQLIKEYRNESDPQTKIHKSISYIFSSNLDGTRKEYYQLIGNSMAPRYRSPKFKEQVKKDYHSI